MWKKYKKNNKQNILNSKAIEFSNIVEQGIEDVLNGLLSNSYKQYNNGFDNITKNKSAADKLCIEIKELAKDILSHHKDINLLSFILPSREKNSDFKNFIGEIIRILKFIDHLKDIHNTVELIKININELYKYPTLKKQAYIPEFSLTISSFFKENIDSFFMHIVYDEAMQYKAASELSKIISLGNKMMNEFFLNISSENNNNPKDPGNQVIYYSNIISLLELISINSLEFISI